MPIVAVTVVTLTASRLRLPISPVTERSPPLSMSSITLSDSGLASLKANEATFSCELGRMTTSLLSLNLMRA